MTKEELASSLNGMQYGGEISEELIEKDKQHSLVIVINDYDVLIDGGDDEFVHIIGCGSYEYGFEIAPCLSDAEYFIDCNGFLPEREDIEDDDVLDGWLKRKKSAKKISAVWTPNGYPTWSYRTSIPHTTFDVLEDGDVYCKGIVFELASL